ncbi:hypothetical protein D3C87_1883370 [compost metagenome]
MMLSLIDGSVRSVPISLESCAEMLVNECVLVLIFSKLVLTLSKSIAIKFSTVVFNLASSRLVGVADSVDNST